jgi:hypothetical protein
VQLSRVSEKTVPKRGQELGVSLILIEPTDILELLFHRTDDLISRF